MKNKARKETRLEGELRETKNIILYIEDEIICTHDKKELERLHELLDFYKNKAKELEKN